jgi:uncharacterized protein DUF389
VLPHLRVTVPPDRTGEVVDLLARSPSTAHPAALPGASVAPPGDLVMADVARESADALVDELRGLGVARDGGITMGAVAAAVSSAAERAEERAPGDGADAVVWEQVVRTTDADSALSASYLAFLTIATLLCGVAIVNDSAVLLIGAMVLGPEFAPLAGRALGWFGTEVLTTPRPGTGFTTAPDRGSVVVAVLAGVAGVLSLTSTKSGALVGVFISVTTVPAAADMAVALALGGGTESPAPRPSSASTWPASSPRHW